MAVVAHEAEMSRPTSDGAGSRAHLTRAAAKGHAEAIAKLAIPPFPDVLAYLHDWFRELSAARGEGMHGPAPITHQGIDAWARLTDRQPEPHEVHALLTLDAAWRSALRGDPTPDTPADATEHHAPAWPTKRGG